MVRFPHDLSQGRRKQASPGFSPFESFPVQDRIQGAGGRIVRVESRGNRLVVVSREFSNSKSSVK
jgi:hypothetical protein